MRTAVEMIDDLVAGTIPLDDVVADFAQRAWRSSPNADDLQDRDATPGDDNSWAAVSADPRLTTEQYRALGRAYKSGQIGTNLDTVASSLGPSDTSTDTELTAGTEEVHTGAMIALIPKDPDALALDTGEPASELHMTILYLGEAALIPEETQHRLVEIMEMESKYMPTVVGNAFAVNYFNLDSDEPCVVLGLSGGQLESVHERLCLAAVVELARVGVELPKQHQPWIPHVTLLYGQEVDLPSLAEKLGPIEFGAVRLAFAGENYDIPLGTSSAEDDDAMRAAGWTGELL